MTNRIRIIDIAKKAGVSKGTVDRVLHNRGNVAKKVKDRILAVMEELNYRPNLIARSLANNKVSRIATFLPHPSEDPFWEQPDKGIEQAYESVRDYGILIDKYNYLERDISTFNQQAKRILAGNYDAVLVAPIFYKEANTFLEQCELQDLPYVLVNTYLKGKGKHYLSYIGQDSYHSGVLAAKLLDFGISDNESVMVLHLESSVYNSRHLLEKEQGFQNFFINHPSRNIQVIKTSFEDLNNKADFKKFMELQLKSYPSLKGIFVTTSRLNLLVEALPEKAVEHLKLVGFDLIQKNLDLLHEEKIDFLINQNPVKQGYLGIINIFNYLIKKELPKPIQHLPLDVVMKENASYYLESEEQLHFVV